MNRRLALESADACSRTEVRKDVPTLGGGARCDTTSKMEAEDVGEGTVLLYLNKSIGLASPGVRGAYAELLSCQRMRRHQNTRPPTTQYAGSAVAIALR